MIASALGCEAALARLPRIIAQGNSADRQEDVYRQRCWMVLDNREALRAVVDQVIGETEQADARTSIMSTT